MKGPMLILQTPTARRISMAEKAAAGSIFLAPGEGKGTAPGGPRQINIKIAGEPTGGRYSIVEDTVPAGYATELHVHRNTDEAFYVVKGPLLFQLGVDKREAPTGTFLFIPRGIPHAFMNPTTESATYVLIISPPGFEKYFEERATVANSDPTPETLASISARHDREVIGPLMTA
jgi:quercetin dioxygenase-like cupin family protein